MMRSDGESSPRRLHRIFRASLGFPAWGRYALATIAVLGVFLLHLTVFSPPIAPFVFFYVAVVVAAWFGGRGPGLFAVLLSAAVANYAFMVPQWRFVGENSPLTATGLFVVAGTVVALFVASFRESFARSERIAEALRESELRLRQMADAMPQLVWTAEPDGTVDYYNERTSGFAGFERRANGSWTWASVLHPDDVAATAAAWAQALASGSEYEISHRVQGADGRYRWYLSRAVPARDAAGRIVKWYGTATDIDGQKRAEDALKEGDRRKNEFLAVLSHELRNPLAPIQYSAYLLGRAEPGGQQSERARQVIERQVHHLTRLIDDLLDVTRIASGKIHLQTDRVDLGDLVRRTAEDHRSVFASEGVALHVSLEASPLFVIGDATRIAQAVGNLLGNAAKFTSRGGKVSLTLASEGTNAVIRVRDDGAGIRPELLDRVFDPFTQAEQTLDRSRGGLGLGLALVKGLVEMHGGRVEVHSAGEGEGAEFSAWLPLTAGPAEVAGPQARRTSKKRRVLVIEDNIDVAESLRDVLVTIGHEVAIAVSGPEGLEEAHRIRPDVILCDIGLPGFDGYEVARRMRADPALHAVGLVALSGYALPEDVERSKRAGFDRHVAKPPGIDVLEAALADLGDPRVGPPPTAAPAPSPRGTGSPPPPSDPSPAH
jgi:PAS domain S-box-containing protein